MAEKEKAGFSAQERAAMKERAAELRAEAKREKGAKKAAAEEAELLAKIEQMPDGDRQMAQRVHSIVASAAPDLAPKLYYGQPGYARGGKVVVFFRSGAHELSVGLCELVIGLDGAEGRLHTQVPGANDRIHACSVQ